MRIKRFESFSGDEPYVRVTQEDHLNNYRYNSVVFDDKDLFFIFNNIEIKKTSLIFYYTIDDKFHNSCFEFTSPKFAYERLLGRDVVKIIIDTMNIDIFKDDDNYYWVNHKFYEKFKCDELSGLKELIKDLGI